MAYENKPNRGGLFVNTIKKSKDSPDYRGDLLIDLKAFEIENNMIKVRLSGWKSKTAKGGTYLSLSAQQHKEKEEQSTNNQGVQDDEDIPF